LAAAKRLPAHCPSSISTSRCCVPYSITPVSESCESSTETTRARADDRQSSTTFAAGGAKAIAAHSAAITATESQSRLALTLRMVADYTKKWYNPAMDNNSELVELVRSIPDFPKPGVLFRDVTGILDAPGGLTKAVDEMCAALEGCDFDRVAAPEARGFIFGAALADRLGKAFVPVRKPGKLPRKTVSENYELEYGEATLHIHVDAISPGDRVVIVDDLLATGGTAAAAARLVERLGGVVVKVMFPVELEGFGARAGALAGRDVVSLVRYRGT